MVQRSSGCKAKGAQQQSLWKSGIEKFKCSFVKGLHPSEHLAGHRVVPQIQIESHRVSILLKNLAGHRVVPQTQLECIRVNILLDRE
jgi:hypothetical protein